MSSLELELNLVSPEQENLPRSVSERIAPYLVHQRGELQGYLVVFQNEWRSHRELSKRWIYPRLVEYQRHRRVECAV